MEKQKLITKLSSLSVVFPAFNDAASLPSLLKKTLDLLPQIASDYEIIIVDDGSWDKTQEILTKFQKTTPRLKVITHPQNQGYGAALICGFQNATKELIFYTDSDGQYDVLELRKLWENFDSETDFITGFKLRRADAWYRKIIGASYNQSVRFFFGLKVRDIDCDFRLFRRSILKDINFQIRSGAFDVEFIKRLQEKGVKFREVPVHHYPRLSGQSQFFNFRSIFKSLWDLGRLFFS